MKDFEFMGLVVPTRRTMTETRGDVLGERLLLTSGLSTPGNTPEKTRDKKDR